MLVGVTLFPVACLGLLLWLTHLEETLPRAVRAATREPAPPPITAIPVRRSAVVAVAAPVVPAQRVQAFSRSEAMSLGGSTNR